MERTASGSRRVDAADATSSAHTGFQKASALVPGRAVVDNVGLGLGGDQLTGQVIGFQR